MSARRVLRRAMREPATTVAIVLPLALGIGANAAVFTLVDRVLFRPLPVREPRALVRVGSADVASGPATGGLSYPLYREYRGESRSFSGLAASRDSVPVHLARAEGEAERVSATLVSGDYFAVLGVASARGRMIAPEDDERAAPARVVVLSDGFWRRRFAGDPDVIGTAVSINGARYDVIGVAPPGFTGIALDHVPDLWLPIAVAAEAEPIFRTELDHLSNPFFDVVGRLRPGMSPAQAQAELLVVARHHGAGQPVTDPTAVEAGSDWRRPWPRVGPIDAAAGSPARRTALLLIGVALLVLAMACADAAAVLAARGLRRRREHAVQRALGATALAVAREALVEGLAFAAMGALAGVAVAALLLRLIVWIAPAESAALTGGSDALTVRALACAAGMALAVGAAAAALPAVASARAEILPGLRAGAFGVAGVRRVDARRGFVFVQIVCTVVLLSAFGVLLRTLQHAAQADLGFDASVVTTASIDFPRQGYDKSRVLAALPQLGATFASSPGVRASAIASAPAPAVGMTTIDVGTDAPQRVGFGMVTPGYFDALGAAVARGRDFAAGDVRESPRVGIVNRAFAERYWPGQDPIGRRLARVGPEGIAVEIVGLAPDLKTRDVRDAPEPVLYVSLAQFYASFPWQPATHVVVRAADARLDVHALIQGAVARVDRRLPVFAVRSAAENVGGSVAPGRMLARLLALFGVLAVVLATSGIYGLGAFAAASRASEFGTRLAIGATQRQILRLVLGEALALASLALAAGLAVSFVVNRSLESLLFGVSIVDPATCGAVAVLLWMTVVAATALPAYRASRTDPARVLRAE